jgi:hypothetical protein
MHTTVFAAELGRGIVGPSGSSVYGGAMMRSGSGFAGAKCLALAGAWAGRLAYTRRDGFAWEMARGPPSRTTFQTWMVLEYLTKIFHHTVCS